VRMLTPTLLILLFTRVSSFAGEAVMVTNTHDKMVEVFVGITIEAKQNDTGHCRASIQEGMRYETAERAETLRQYLAQLQLELNEDKAAYRELLLCQGRETLQGDDLVQAMNDAQDAILVYMKKYYYRARSELATDDWNRLNRWISERAESTVAWRKYFGQDDLETVKHLSDKFCAYRSDRQE